MKLSVNKETACRIPRTQLNTLAELIAKRERVNTKAELNLILVDDHTQRKLNRDYRKKDKTTDVLSFTYEVDKFSLLIGEIYISIPQTERQAREYRRSFAEEFLRLFCHGMLHVLGYDHGPDEEERRMFRKQDRYLGAVCPGAEKQFRQ